MTFYIKSLNDVRCGVYCRYVDRCRSWKYRAPSGFATSLVVPNLKTWVKMGEILHFRSTQQRGDYLRACVHMCVCTTTDKFCLIVVYDPKKPVAGWVKYFETWRGLNRKKLSILQLGGEIYFIDLCLTDYVTSASWYKIIRMVNNNSPPPPKQVGNSYTQATTVYNV